MNDLISYIQELTPKIVDRQKLFRYLYNHKIKPDMLWFKLSTASRLVRQNYLDEFSNFEEEGIYES